MRSSRWTRAARESRPRPLSLSLDVRRAEDRERAPHGAALPRDRAPAARLGAPTGRTNDARLHTHARRADRAQLALSHWYAAQRACGIRVRGLYSTKDTFVTTALEAGVTIAWLETQTGVNYLTLRRHYGRWMPSDVGRELERFAALDPGLLAEFTPPVVTGNKRNREQRRETPTIPRISRCERGDLNPHGVATTGS